MVKAPKVYAVYRLKKDGQIEYRRKDGTWTVVKQEARWFAYKVVAFRNVGELSKDGSDGFEYGVSYSDEDH